MSQDRTLEGHGWKRDATELAPGWAPYQLCQVSTKRILLVFGRPEHGMLEVRQCVDGRLVVGAIPLTDIAAFRPLGEAIDVRQHVPERTRRRLDRIGRRMGVVGATDEEQRASGQRCRCCGCPFLPGEPYLVDREGPGRTCSACASNRSRRDFLIGLVAADARVQAGQDPVHGTYLTVGSDRWYLDADAAPEILKAGRLLRRQRAAAADREADRQTKNDAAAYKARVDARAAERRGDGVPDPGPGLPVHDPFL